MSTRPKSAMAFHRTCRSRSTETTVSNALVTPRRLRLVQCPLLRWRGPLTGPTIQYLAPWANFYVIVGSSAAALVGVQFVVIALIANFRHLTTADSIRAFGTPTVVHLGEALVVSSILSAPWHSLLGASIALTLCGLGGLGYAGIAIHRARRQTAYKPVWDDWFWYAALPCSAYTALSAAAVLLRTATQPALFVIGGTSLGLLLIGIHNAWDSVTHVVLTGLPGDATK